MINELVEAGLRDANFLDAPPTTAEELDYVAETVTDHLVAALSRGELSKRDDWWGRQPSR
ncbi:hypothetical protein GCM10027053_18580 [Intrasporangium mesophilum]